MVGDSRLKKTSSISIYTTTDFPNGGAGENFVKHLALGLNKQHVQINVIRLMGQSFQPDSIQGIKSSNFIFKHRSKNDLFKIFELLLTVLYSPFALIKERFLNKSNLILIYGVEYSYKTLPFLFTSRLLGMKIFRIITDYYEPKTIVPVWWKKPKHFFYSRQFRFLDKHFNGLIVLSHYLKEICLKNGATSENVCVIPHLIDISSFDNNLSQPKSETRKVIGFCGTTNSLNGILDLLEAFKILLKEFKEIKLLIIGENSQEITDFLDANYDNESRKKMTVTGFLNKSEVVKHLNSCDILVNPRRSGQFAEAGFPTKIGEYFSTKKPVVSTYTSDFKRYFTSGKELIFAENNNANSLHNSIKTLLLDPVLREKIGLSGYNWAKNNLEFQTNTKKILDFIESH
jgi:glycosyltransferase involved in cell wall biosynthesis